MAKQLIVLTGDRKDNFTVFSQVGTSSHVPLFEDYFKQENLPITTSKKMSYDLSVEVAHLKDIPILIEDKIFCIFMPEEITQSQADYLLENRKNLGRQHLLIVDVREADEYYFRDEVDSGESYEDILYKLVDTRVVKGKRR